MMGSRLRQLRHNALAQKAIFSAALLGLTVCEMAFSQTQMAPATSPAAIKPLEDGWQDVDPRMVFLTIQLSSVEASLNAVGKAILMAGDQQTAKKQASEQYRKGNELMDRKGGGPAAWSEFYGKTAEKFFYRPTGRNSYYHTIVVLRPGQYDSTADGTTARNTMPSNRPPQFDYIYRANVDAQKQAEADIAKLGNKIDTLTDRRRNLENEQSALWCRIAFRGAMSRAVMDDPIYQFEIKKNTADSETQQREALLACIEFMRTSYRIIARADAAKDLDQNQFFGQLEAETAAARTKLNERLIKLDQFAGELNDIKNTLGKYIALSKRSRDVAKNITEAYQLAADGDQAGDKQRQKTFRELLQDSLIAYCEIVLAEDECIGQMAKEWSLSPNLAAPLAESERRIEPVVEAKPQPAVTQAPAQTVTAKPTEVTEPAAEKKRIAMTPPPWSGPRTAEIVRDGSDTQMQVGPPVSSIRPSATTMRSTRSSSRDVPTIPLTGKPRDILLTMSNPFARPDEMPTAANPMMTLKHFGSPHSAERFSPPVKFHFDAMTEETNIRFRFGSRFIFNWEMNKDELRVDMGPVSGMHKKGAGFVQPNVWHSFDMIVTNDSVRVVVDGQDRFYSAADFSRVNDYFHIETNGSTVRVKTLTVSLP